MELGVATEQECVVQEKTSPVDAKRPKVGSSFFRHLPDDASGAD